MALDYNIYTSLAPQEFDEVVRRLIDAFPDLLEPCNFVDMQGKLGMSLIDTPLRTKTFFKLNFLPSSYASFRYRLIKSKVLTATEWTLLFYVALGFKNSAVIYNGEYLSMPFGGLKYLFEDGPDTSPPDLYNTMLPEFLAEYRDQFQKDVYIKKHVDLKPPTIEK